MTKKETVTTIIVIPSIGKICFQSVIFKWNYIVHPPVDGALGFLTEQYYNKNSVFIRQSSLKTLLLKIDKVPDIIEAI